MRRTFWNLLFVVAVACVAAGQQASRDAGAPDAGRLRAHVAYLASDKLEGRRTGTVGAGAAAEYVAAEFAHLGLRPGGDRAGAAASSNGQSAASAYLQAFPYVAGVEPGKANSMLFIRDGAPADARPATLDLRLKDDWMPLGFTANARVENSPVTFVGYGITASELSYDDYAGADASGRIVVAFAGTPDGDNPHGQFTRYNEVRFKAAAARDHGARALVLVASEENFQDERLAQLRFDNAGGDAGLPVVVISRASARRILEVGGITAPLDELEKAMRAPRAAETNAPRAGEAAQAAATGQSQATATRRNFSAALRGVALSISTDLVRRNEPAFNVVGILEGSDPQLKREAIVVGAHYDHLGRGGQGSLAAREGDIHHGADDNASGTAALMELARLLSQERPRTRRSIVFVAFSGEEEGLLGSSFYVNHPSVPLADTVAMLNMDMVGRLKDGKLMIGGVGTAGEWKPWLAQINETLDVQVTAGARRERNGGSPRDGNASHGSNASHESNASPHDAPKTQAMTIVTGANGQVIATATPAARFALTLNEDGFGPSDHSSFYAQKIPVLFFFTGTHEDYHKPSDTADRINYEGEARIVALVRDVVRSVDVSAARPTYAVARSEAAGRSTGFRVYLGTVPNYAEASDGLRLDAVRDDSPASRAGLRAGDRIVKLAGRDVRNVYDYTYALSEMRAGQEYEVEIVREGQLVRLKITPAARK